MNKCKYCGCEIPNGYFCCRSCWDDFEEPRDNEDDFENETEEDEES